MKDEAVERDPARDAGQRRHLRRDDQGGRAAARAAQGPASRESGCITARWPPADRKATQDALHGGRAQGDDRDERVRARHRQAGPALRGALPLSRARVEAYYQEAGRAGRDGDPAACTILYRVEDSRMQSYFLGGKYPDVEEAAQVALVLEQYPLGEPVQLDELAEQRGVRAAQGAHRARAAQAARPGARAPRRQLGAAARAGSRTVDLSADLTDYEERRAQDQREAPADGRLLPDARSAARGSSSSTSARARARLGVRQLRRLRRAAGLGGARHEGRRAGLRSRGARHASI